MSLIYICCQLNLWSQNCSHQRKLHMHAYRIIPFYWTLIGKCVRSKTTVGHREIFQKIHTVYQLVHETIWKSRERAENEIKTMAKRFRERKGINTGQALTWSHLRTVYCCQPLDTSPTHRPPQPAQHSHYSKEERYKFQVFRADKTWCSEYHPNEHS